MLLVFEECLKVFEQLKAMLTFAPIIQPPNWEEHFEIMYVHLTVQLEQFKCNVLIDCFMWSIMLVETLHDAQLKYSTTEKELLAVVFALYKF